MNKGFIFFCCACAILLFTIINLCIGPIISRTVGTDWGYSNCKSLSDAYDVAKKANNPDDVLKNDYKWPLRRCRNRKAMYNMEYTSFIFDITIGFVCALLGLMHLFDLNKAFIPKTGLIGLGCGFVGFILTFVYVIFNGIVYTSYYDDYYNNNDIIYKINGDGAFAELKNGKYECLYYDKPDNEHALYAKYSDFSKKQYNYDKDLISSFNSEEVYKCEGEPVYCINNQGTINGPLTYLGSDGKSHDCHYLYKNYNIVKITNKDKSDRFLTSLILSLLVCLAHIGLCLFGFFLFKTPDDSFVVKFDNK